MEMGLQRSQQTFRRSGSSGLVWDERFISGDLSRAGGAAGEEEVEEDRTLGRRQGGRSELTRSQSTGSSGGGRAANGRLWRRGGGNDIDVEGGFRAGAVAPAADPPSPDVHGCSFCRILGGGKPKSPGQRSARRRRR